MRNLAKLASGLPVLLILDQAGVVCHASRNLEDLLGNQAVKAGSTLPKNLLGWRQERPWETEVNGRALSFVAEAWTDYTLLLVTDSQGDFSGAATILNSIDEGIHVVNKHGQTVFYNPTMAKMEGMDYNQVINKDVLALFPSLTPETSTILRALRTREPVYDQVQTYFNNKGQRITSLNSTIPLWNGSDFIGVLEVAKDVTRMEDLALKVVDLQQRLYKRRQGMDEQAKMYNFADIVGNSPALRHPLEIARRAARTTSPVLIYGETGTGKELVAQSIHQLSARGAKPFIAQNCAALPGTLLEGILFGTVKGSFTGAVDRPGLIEQAHGGTLLLDEINSMDIDLQAKLLRVLQEHRVRRVGGLKEIPIDVRIIATTNTQPKVAVSQGSIRQDLYYRLAVVNINLPPLSQRREDIPLLCRHFVDKYNRKFDLAIQGVTSESMEIFYAHLWPGNVRELEHVIEGAMNIIGEEEIYIDLHHLPPNMVPQQPVDRNLTGLENCTLPEAVDLVERGMIRRAMDQTGGNITRAARLLGITRQALQYKLNK
ncbi:MAG: sigma 54-interacting transcriptional regulator [Eubacteriales bacterium]|nr:sigma 54-interacting transcriptional regulator [Eubacteriales bacterium]